MSVCLSVCVSVCDVCDGGCESGCVWLCRLASMRVKHTELILLIRYGTRLDKSAIARSPRPIIAAQPDFCCSTISPMKEVSTIFTAGARKSSLSATKIPRLKALAGYWGLILLNTSPLGMTGVGGGEWQERVVAGGYSTLHSLPQPPKKGTHLPPLTPATPQGDMLSRV